MGYVGAYLILGGVDFYGPHLYSVHAHGSTSVDPYLADGKFKNDLNYSSIFDIFGQIYKLTF